MTAVKRIFFGLSTGNSSTNAEIKHSNMPNWEHMPHVREVVKGTVKFGGGRGGAPNYAGVNLSKRQECAPETGTVPTWQAANLADANLAAVSGD